MKLTGAEKYFYEKIDAILTALGGSGGSTATSANQTTMNTEIGATNETSAAADNSTSGLNGLIKRLLARFTVLMAQLPTALGQTTMSASLAVVLPSNQSSIPVAATVSSITLPTTIYNNKKLVTTSGVRVALATTQAILSGVTIKALVGNTGVIYVGDSTVASTNGLALAPGDTIFLEIANLATVNLDSSVSGEGVTYIAT